MRRFLIVLPLLLLPMMAHAQYYVCGSQAQCVNNAAPSDSNTGTFASPFLTLGKAQTSMAGGSTKKTIIEPGTYTLAANWHFTTSDAGESWVAYPGATVVISGGASPNVANKYVFTDSGVNNLTFKGLTFQNMGDDGSWDGSLYLRSGGGHVVQYNNFVGCFATCLTIAGPTSSPILVDSNTFTNVINNNIDNGDAIELFNHPSNVTVSHNLCQYTSYSCASLSGGATDTGVTNIVYDSNVSVAACADLGATGNTDCGAFYMMDRSRSMTASKIINNVVAGSNQGGTRFTDLASNGSSCIYLDDTAQNVDVSGNLCFSDPGAMMLKYHGTKNITVHNNVFVMAPGADLALYQDDQSWCGNAPCPMTGNTMQNNVIWLTGAVNSNYYGGNFFGPWIITGGTGATSNLPTISGNLYYLGIGGSFQNAQNSSTDFHDTAPIYCGPSMGGNLAGGMAATKLWQSVAGGVIGGWLPLAVNQGPTFRNCSTGF